MATTMAALSRKTFVRISKDGYVRIKRTLHKSTKLQRPERALSISDKSELEGRLRDYCANHSYNLGAVEAFGPNPKDSNDMFRYSESFSSASSRWEFEWKQFDGRVPAISSRTVFRKGYEVLQKYTDNEKISHSEEVAVTALEKFFANREKHHESLRCLQNMRKEPHTASVLSHHFLAQLLPHSTNYCVDKFSKGRPEECPCGCGELIQYGITQIGSPQLFYGSTDIALYPSQKDVLGTIDDSLPSVFTIMKSEDKGERHGDLHDEVEWKEEEADEDVEFTSDECEINEENSQHHLFKRAIALSLCRRKSLMKSSENIRTISNLPTMVPVCGITADTFDVFMYDVDNDFLLKMCRNDSKLFDDNQIKFSTVINIWMLIYYDLFCHGPSAGVQSKLHATCNLIPQIGSERFKQIIEQSKWFCMIEGHCSRSLGSVSDCDLLRVDTI